MVDNGTYVFATLVSVDVKVGFVKIIKIVFCKADILLERL